jgi:hypothetical protein
MPATRPIDISRAKASVIHLDDLGDPSVCAPRRHHPRRGRRGHCCQRTLKTDRPALDLSALCHDPPGLAVRPIRACIGPSDSNNSRKPPRGYRGARRSRHDLGPAEVTRFFIPGFTIMRPFLSIACLYSSLSLSRRFGPAPCAAASDGESDPQPGPKHIRMVMPISA